MFFFDMEMKEPLGNQRWRGKKAISASELFPEGIPPEDSQPVPRLVLKFMSVGEPKLERIEFHGNASKKFEFRQLGLPDDPEHTLKFTSVAKALAMFFLDYICAWLKQPPKMHRLEGGNGSMAATLGYALARKENSDWYHLFAEYTENGGKLFRVEWLFGGDNWNGDNPGQRVIFVNADYLPAQNIEVFWKPGWLTKPEQFRELADLFRRTWKLPPPIELDLTEGEGGKKESQPAPSLPPKQTSQAEPRPEKQPELELPRSDPAPKPEPKPEQSRQAEPEPGKKPAAPEPPKAAERPVELEPVQPKPETEILPARIDAELFTVSETGHQWPDDIPLIAWGEEDSPRVWTLKNAFEGVLIMGATGSGKTTGSGAAIAESFLRQGFGGLIMTVKADEAERWRRLCEYCGRPEDFICVQRGGDWKLNVLAYVAEATGRGKGLSENLVAFCRTLLAISTRSQGVGLNDQFWQTASAQLLNATFDLFLLSGSQPAFDRLSDFIAAAPTTDIPKSEPAWLKVPVFGGVLARAKTAAVSPEDKRILKRATGYWFDIYPALAAKTRSSITLGVYSMLDAFRGRDIPALISSDTNLTPESIMSGKIVVLDLPVEELGQTGLLVQSAWKYLFQTALERQSRAGKPGRRPVFLWEDEGQRFFSEHDHHFQATARSARVCHVVLSQNVHNFYMEFGNHGYEAANSVFGNLNTKIFHANSDPQTNQWAATHFGQELRTRVSISQNSTPRRPASKEMSDSFLEALNPPSNVGFSTHEQWEYAVRPEEFNCLRNGGPENDFQVDAYITWTGATGHNEKHFTQITFNQNPNL